MRGCKMIERYEVVELIEWLDLVVCGFVIWEE